MDLYCSKAGQIEPKTDKIYIIKDRTRKLDM